MLEFLQIVKQLAVWITLIAAIFLTNFFSYKLRIRRFQTIETLAQKGLSIPPELLTTGRGNDRQRIRAGTHLLCLALAVAVFFWILGGTEVDGSEIPASLAVLAIFPAMIGLAQFIIILLNKYLKI
jgi:hypothetical protein